MNLRPEDFDAVVATYIRDTPPEASARHAGTVAELRGLNLFVCTHAVSPPVRHGIYISAVPYDSQGVKYKPHMHVL